MIVRRPFTRQQRTTIIHGMLAFVVMLVILQIWLLTATMNATLGGDTAAIWPAAGASLMCLLLNVGLLRYLYVIDHGRRQAESPPLTRSPARTVPAEGARGQG